MASRAKNRDRGPSSEEIAELLDDLQKRIDRCKVMFEQYFLGIQKTAPSQLHRELERKIRKLTQTHINNTGLRFRFTTLSQKFASYNTYWKRTLRQIENGTYLRDMARMQRHAQRTGKDIPEEMLAKMPKRMRDRIIRDREAAAKRQQVAEERETALRGSGKVRENKPGNVHQLDESDLLEDVDLDSIFSGMMQPEQDSEPAPQKPAEAPPAGKSPPKRRAASADDTDVDQLFTGAFSDDTVEEAPLPSTPQRPAAAAPRVAARPRPAPKRAAPKPAAPKIKPPPGMSESDGQALFKQYKKARALVGENTANLSYDKLMRSLNKQAPKIIEQHKAKGVSFNVVVKGDRVVLKAKPKK